MPSTEKKSLKTFFQDIKKTFTFNIGTILFGVLFIYIVISLVMYLTYSHFTSYRVVNGPLSRNETYTGLALHREQVVSSELGGYINYYAREGTKINASGIVYGISSEPLQISEMQMTPDDLSKVRRQMSNFSYGFHPANFNNTYSFKSELEGNILQYAGVPVTAENADTSSDSDSDSDSNSEETTQAPTAVSFGNQTISRAQEDGIVLYSRDGYENVTEDTITEDDFDQNAYHKDDLKTRDAIEAGQDVYSIIVDERWSLYIPLSAKQATQLGDRTSIRVKFLKDGLTQRGDFSIVEIGDGKYGRIDFNNGLIRYAADRFLDIELVTNTQSGLKIPLSSIITKEFYLIPKEYQTKGGNDQSAGFLAEQKGGSGVTEFVSATIYDEDDNYYYVERSAFENGDVLIKPDSDERFVVGETGNLEGVYCINEGYARFRRIIIIDQNEEYCIVEKGTPYGLSQYDNIVFDAADVNEEDILY